MNRKNDFAKAFAITAVVLWSTCALFTFFFPGVFLILVRWMCHGMDIASLGEANITFTGFLGGGAVIAVASAVAGYILGWSLDVVQRGK